MSAPRPPRRVEVPAALQRVPAARVVLGLLVLFALVHLYRKAHGVTFWYDEWDFVLDRRSWDAAAFLEPHNEHLSAVPVLAYKLLMSTVGIREHDPYLVVLLLLHALCGVLVFLVVRRRLGEPLAVCAAALVLFLGSAWLDIIWAFQIGFLASLAAGLGIVLALERRDRRGDGIACLLLAIAIASSSLGIPILIGVGAYLLARPERIARAWVWAVPLFLYGVWYLGYGKSALKRENLTDAPAYAVEMMSAGAAGLVNQGHELGRIIFGIGAYLLITRTVRSARVPSALIGLVAAGLAFWMLTGIARAHLGEPTTSRYVYPSALALLLIGAEAARGLRVTRVGLVVAALITAGAVLSGLGRFHDASVDLKGRSGAVRVALGAVDLAGTAMPPEFIPSGEQAPQVAVGPYLEAVRDLGETPAMTREELRTASAVDRAYFDATLIAGLGGSLVEEAATPVGAAPSVEPTQDGQVETKGSCVTFTPSKVGGRLFFGLPENGVQIASKGTLATKVTLRRFADEPREIGEIPGGAARVLRVKKDAAPEPWQAGVIVDEPAEICGL